MDSDSNWLTKFGYIDDSDYDLWVTSMYFTVTTITTVGYGDISAQNASERIFGSILKIAGVLIFSVTSGALTSIITNLDA
jgi:voltage-gated potassium channel Kch